MSPIGNGVLWQCAGSTRAQRVTDIKLGGQRSLSPDGPIVRNMPRILGIPAFSKAREDVENAIPPG